MFRERLRQRSQRERRDDADGALPARPRLGEAADRLTGQFAFGGVIDEEPAAIDAIARRLRETTHADEGSLEGADLRYAPHCLWSGSYPLAETDATAAERVIEAIVGGRRRAPLRTLALAYLRHYAPDRAGIELAGRALHRVAPARGEKLGALAADFATFDPEHGVSQLAAYCFRSHRAPWEVLAGYGLQGDVLHRGLAAHAAVDALGTIRDELTKAPSQELVAAADRLTFYRDEAAFQGAQPALVGTLVAPLRAGELDVGLAECILDRLRRRVGDPHHKPGVWDGAPDEAAVVTRWLGKIERR